MSELTTSDFIDAARIYYTLEAVDGAANLYQAASERFPEAEGSPVEGFDDAAFRYLLAEGFLGLSPDLRQSIDRFRQLERDGDRLREELASTYRRIQDTTTRLRMAEKKRDQLRLLKGMTERWDIDQRCTDLAREVEELTLRRRRLESDLERGIGLYQEVIDQIHGSDALREGYWFHDLPIVITKHGRFLFEYLEEMNPIHFHGRTLAEILQIGMSLA